MLVSSKTRDEAARTQAHHGTTTGDFDQTPAPSARPSMAQIRTEDEGLTSDHSSSPKDLISHSSIAKDQPGGQGLADSASNVSAHHSPRASVVLPDSASERSKTDHENHTTTSPRRTSASVGTRSNTSSSAHNRGVSPPIPLADRICLDPTLHSKKTHAHAHHPGLLRGADFCDSGAPTKGGQHLWTSQGHTSSSSDNFSIKSGRIFANLPGGDNCTVPVKIQVPRPIGHSRAVKVRPIQGEYAVYRPVTLSVDPSRGHNKIAPFDPALEGLDSGASQADVEDNASLTDAEHAKQQRGQELAQLAN